MSELTLRSIIIAIFLTILLAVSNAYLALKLGILTSASIPAAIISMGILRLFKNPSRLENNAVQTAASAGEAVAGGIVYTIPGLIMIGYWHSFDYVSNFLIAALGGTLGVLFSCPLRRVLVNDQNLKFPEGRAIAEVLSSAAGSVGLKHLIWGSVLGSSLELLQVGFKLIANQWTAWFTVKKAIFGVGLGFSTTMIGAGYLMGFDMACSIFIGAVLAWLLGLPMVSLLYPNYLLNHPVPEAASLLWSNELRYLSIGAMLFAGVWTFIRLIKPLLSTILLSMQARKARSLTLHTDKDLPYFVIIMGTLIIAGILYVFFQHIFPLDVIGFPSSVQPHIIFAAVMYVLVFGFLFSVITAYFSGMVGVTASPGSSVVIAGILFAAWALLALMHGVLTLPIRQVQTHAAEATVIIIGALVTGIAAIANDNSQDLKVGQLVGATPWKQQLMLLLGVLVSSLVIPPVMQVLFNVYGIAGVMPHPGMDAAQSLPAPVAALLAAITEGVFHHELPWDMMFLGAIVIVIVLLLNRLFKLQKYLQISILGVAIGMYLPLSSSMPLFIGGVFSWLASKRLRAGEASLRTIGLQTGTLIACGLVAGSALMDVFLAIPFSLLHSPDALSLVGASWYAYGVMLAFITTVLLGAWIVRRVIYAKNS